MNVCEKGEAKKTLPHRTEGQTGTCSLGQGRKLEPDGIPSPSAIPIRKTLEGNFSEGFFFYLTVSLRSIWVARFLCFLRETQDQRS